MYIACRYDVYARFSFQMPRKYGDDYWELYGFPMKLKAREEWVSY